MLRIIVETVSPVHLSYSPSVGTFSPTLDYIPGSVIRGVLAKWYDENISSTSEFNKVFFHERTFFSSLTPTGGYKRSKVIPKTAYSCKYKPGFMKNGSHGVYDMLYDFLDKDKQTIKDTCGHDNNCNASIIPISGYYAGTSKYESIEVRKRIEMKTSINSEVNTISSSNLYQLEFIEEQQKFSGFINFSKKDLETAFFNKLSKNKLILRIGSKTSSGNGKIILSELEKYEPQKLAEQEERLESLQKIIRENFNNKYLQPDETIFTITLQSDTILLDKRLNYKNNISPTDLAYYVHPKLIDSTPNLTNSNDPQIAFSSSKIIGGWNHLWGTPKKNANIIEAGSVFIFKIKTNRKDLIKWFTKAENEGIGERRAEGFGEILFCDEFHLRNIGGG
ncbi:MAG: CRISPR-associated RAMP protein Csx10 [Anaerolineaceae bacterium]|nr:CRISPR-associated RAMP protein Csx10 [Anaerolineaceae bacterium]